MIKIGIEFVHYYRTRITFKLDSFLDLYPIFTSWTIFKIIIKFNPSKEPKYVIHRALNLEGKKISPVAVSTPAISNNPVVQNPFRKRKKGGYFGWKRGTKGLSNGQCILNKRVTRRIQTWWRKSWKNNTR